MGARQLYVSATNTCSTVDFYRRQGCMLSIPADPAAEAIFDLIDEPPEMAGAENPVGEAAHLEEMHLVLTL